MQYAKAKTGTEAREQGEELPIYHKYIKNISLIF